MPKRKWIENVTPEERAAHMEKMRAGRKAAKEDKIVGELIEPPQSENGVLGALDDINWHGQSEGFLRYAVGLLDKVRGGASEALSAAIDRRTADYCGNPNCKNRLPANGRHAGELSWNDHVTHAIKVLRACSPGCYPAISAVARQHDFQKQEERHQRVSHA